MNMENGGGSCPLPSCPDRYGTLPSCAGLSVPYVPFQQEGSQKYSQSDALSNGTLFPGLNLPFHLKVEGSTVPSGPLAELQALEFVVAELGLYLDTHADDQEAFGLYRRAPGRPTRPSSAPSPRVTRPTGRATGGSKSPGPGILSRTR